MRVHIPFDELSEDDKKRAARLLACARIFATGCTNTEPLNLPPTECVECAKAFAEACLKFLDADPKSL